MSSSTRTKNTPALSAAAQSRQVLDQAETDHTHLKAREDQANTAVDDLAARVDHGDQTVTAIEWLTAEAEQKISAGLAAWAARQVKNARTRLINDDTRLADLFSPLLAELFEGMVEVHTTGNPADVSPGDTKAPTLWIVQPQPTVNSGGALSGTLELAYLRPSPILGPLDAERVEEAARRAGYRLRPNAMTSTTRASGGGYRDALRIVVESAAPAVPYLPQAPGEDFSRLVGFAVADAIFPHIKGPVRRFDDGATSGGTVLANHNVQQTKIAPDGSFLATVTTEHHATLASALRTEVERITKAIRLVALPDLVGHLIPEAGRIVAADVQAITYPSDDPAAPKAPWIVRSTLTLSYQL